MARTAIAAGLVALAADAGVAAGAGQAADAVNGNILPFSLTNTPPTFGPFNILLVIANADSAPHTAIIRAAGYTGAPNGAANSGLAAPANQPFTQATLGDLSVAVANGATEVIALTTTDRFVQPNHVSGGDLWIDWTAATGMTFWAYLLPTNPV
ncbi:MAG TPA: hypothetical protein VKU77_33770 [Streptosporangiaceae bacterium]|nr:hypothetical protein [Streptosporangiaceae bacterium]